VNPTRSQNSTETTFRSSSSCVGVAETSGAAHSLQNFARSRFSPPHTEQMAIRGV
jgi:hypothetical protein